MKDFSAYKAFKEEAERDDRLGRDTFIVSHTVAGIFPNAGTPYVEVHGMLERSGAKVKFTVGELMTPAQIEAEKATWDHKRKFAVSQTIAMHEGLAKIDKTPETLGAGDTFLVDVGKTKRNADGTGGFLRIDKIIGAVKDVPGFGGKSGGPGF